MGWGLVVWAWAFVVGPAAADPSSEPTCCPTLPRRDVHVGIRPLSPAPLPIPAARARALHRRCERGQASACVYLARAAEHTFAVSVLEQDEDPRAAWWRLSQAGALWAAACAAGDGPACRYRSTRSPRYHGDLLERPRTCLGVESDDRLHTGDWEPTDPVLTSWGWAGADHFQQWALPRPAYGQRVHAELDDRILFAWTAPGSPISVVSVGPDDQQTYTLPAPPDPDAWLWARAGTLFGGDRHAPEKALSLAPGSTWTDASPPTPLPLEGHRAVSASGDRVGAVQGPVLRVLDASGQLIDVHAPLTTFGSPVPSGVAVAVGPHSVYDNHCIVWLDGGGFVPRAPPELDLPEAPRDVELHGVAAVDGVLAGARVTARTNAGDEVEGRTDAAGSFRLPPLPRARWVVLTARADDRVVHASVATSAGGPIEVTRWTTRALGEEPVLYTHSLVHRAPPSQAEGPWHGQPTRRVRLVDSRGLPLAGMVVGVRQDRGPSTAVVSGLDGHLTVPSGDGFTVSLGTWSHTGAGLPDEVVVPFSMSATILEPEAVAGVLVPGETAEVRRGHDEVDDTALDLEHALSVTVRRTDERDLSTLVQTAQSEGPVVVVFTDGTRTRLPSSAPTVDGAAWPFPSRPVVPASGVWEHDGATQTTEALMRLDPVVVDPYTLVTVTGGPQIWRYQR